MSVDSNRNSAVNAAATTKVFHAQLQDLPLSVARRLYKGGIRPGEAMRTRVEAQEMLAKIPPSQRGGVDSKSAVSNVEKYLSDKHASHIHPHSKGGSNEPYNIKWENGKHNIARGDKPMTSQEQMMLDATRQFDNLTGAIEAGIAAAPKGIIVGAATTIPLSLLTNALRVVRGEISAQQAATETLKDTAIGGVCGGATALTVTTIATLCPPIAVLLTAVSPVLLTVGVGGMVWQFFQILNQHQETVKSYYESLTKQELERLQEIENELNYEHTKNLEFLAQTKAVNEEIKNRPILPGIEGAIQRYQKSVVIAQSLGLTSADSKLLPDSKVRRLDC